MQANFNAQGILSITLHRGRVISRPNGYERDILFQISSVFLGIDVSDPKGLIKKPLESPTEKAEIRLPSAKDFVIGGRTLRSLFSSINKRAELIELLKKHNIETIWISKGNVEKSEYSDIVALSWNGKNFTVEKAFSEDAFSLNLNDSFSLYFAQTSKPKADELRVIHQAQIPKSPSNAAATLLARRGLNAVEIKDKILKAFTTKEIANDFPTPQELEVINFAPEDALEIIKVLTKHNPPSYLINHAQYLGSNKSIRNTFKEHIAEYTVWLKTNIQSSIFAFGLTGSADPVIVKALELTHGEAEARDALARKAAANKPPKKEGGTLDLSHPNTPLNRASVSPAHSPIKPITSPPKQTERITLEPISTQPEPPSSSKETPHRGRKHLLERASGDELLSHTFTNDPSFYDSLHRAMSPEYHDNEKIAFFAQRNDVISKRAAQDRINWAKENPNHYFSQGLGLNEKIIDDKILPREDRIELKDWANNDENKDTKFAKSLKILFEKYPESVRKTIPEIPTEIPPRRPVEVPLKLQTPLAQPHENNGHAPNPPTHKGIKSLVEKVHGEDLLTCDFGTPQTLYNNIHKAMTADFANNEDMVFFGQRKDVITWKSANERLQWAKENPNHCFSEGLGLNQNLLNDKVLSREDRVILNTWANEDENKETKFARSLTKLFGKHPDSLIPESKPEPKLIPAFTEAVETLPKRDPDEIRTLTDINELAEFISILLDPNNAEILAGWILEHPTHPLSLKLLNDPNFNKIPMPRQTTEKLLQLQLASA